MARLRVLYLIAIAVGVFFVPSIRGVAGILAFQLVLWAVLRYPAGQVIRLATKLFWFFFFVLLSFAFFPEEGAEPRWHEVTLAAWSFRISLEGISEGVLMCVRVFTVILTSLLVRRSASSAEFVEGLRGLFLPRRVAYTLDTTLHLLEPEQLDGRMNEEGSGDGEGKNKKGQVVLRDVLRGDVRFFVRRIEQGLEKGQRYAKERYGDLAADEIRDLGVISGLAFVAASLKLLKILPGIPFAPGHKTVLLLPLYLLAVELTRGRWAASLLGICVGVIGFLMGDGRYGIFEILKHIAPGFFLDLFHPLIRLKGGRLPGLLRTCLLGMLAAVGRFATVVTITLLMGAPGAFYAMVAPLALVHLGFGAASGFVSYPLIKSLERLRKAADGTGEASGSVAPSTAQK
ncbi:MAG: energy-coupling factor transporter transmembrane component T [Bdellovibrionota bacterium]